MAKLTLVAETELTCDQLRELVRDCDLRDAKSDPIDPADVGVFDILYVLAKGEAEVTIREEHMTD